MKAPARLLLLLAAVSICSAAPPPTQTVEPREKRVTVEISLGQELKVVLPTTDAQYAWEIAANDQRYLLPKGRLKALPGGPAAGATISFAANRRGRTRLSFVYVKLDNATQTTAADTRDLMVTIQ